MADNPNDGLLSQDEINAALQAAGIESQMQEQTPSPASSETSPAQEPDTRVDASGRPFDEVAKAMAEAIAAEQAVAKAAPEASAPATASAPETAPTQTPAQPFEIPTLPPGTLPTAPAHGLDLLRDVDLSVKIELGRSRMLVEDVLRLGEGSVVELDKLAGDPVDVLVNDRLVARGEVLVLNDNFCVRINDILSRDVGQEEVA
ncbi:MAG TPA: flagellar motor switch protein FliN [Phycisphaerae bacterium]|mgnify:CR=1 FL=1|nr:flagellar motor switch protein FliN [Phycisphaerae bacterium]